MTKSWRWIAVLVVVCVLIATGAWAQEEEAAEEAEPAFTIGADLALNSRYMFWGLTLSNKPVWQPDMYVSWNGFTAGVWGNFEIDDQSSASDRTTGGDRTGNTEIDYWLEYAGGLGSADAKIGVVRWTFHEDNTGTLAPFATQESFPGLDNGPDIDSTEIYAAVTFSEAPLSPNLTLYYDIDLYRGLFGWVAFSQGFDIKGKTLTLGALGGFTNGQDNIGDKDIPLFADEGVTHVDLSASLAFTAGAFTITPNAHLQFNYDDATRITSGTETDNDVVFTFGATIAWSQGIGSK